MYKGEATFESRVDYARYHGGVDYRPVIANSLQRIFERKERVE